MNGLRLLASCLLMLPLSSCLQAPTDGQQERESALEERLLADIDQRIVEVKAWVNNSKAPKSSYNWANTLTAKINDVSGRLTTLEKSLEVNLASEEQAEALLAPIRESIDELRSRVETVEVDMNATLDDLYRMREEVRLVLVTLEGYRRASRESLELQRESLSRQLEALDAVLGPEVEPISQ